MATKQYNTNRRTESTGLMNIIKNLISGKTNDQRRPQRVSQKTIDNMDDLKQNLHPTNIGRALGRKTAGMFMDMFKSDDKKDNVKGRKGRAKETKENKTNNPLYTKVSEGADKPVRKNDTLSDVFSKIYNLLKINTEDNRKRYQLEKNFGEEKEDEREKRHLELLKAISGLTGGGTVTQVVGEKKGDLFGNLLNSVKGMIENFKKLLGPLLEFAKDVGKNGLKMLGKLANLLTGSKLLSVLGKISMGLSLALFSSDLNANNDEDLAAKRELSPYITPGVRKQYSRNEIEQFVKHKEWFNDDKLKNREAGFPGTDRETLQQWLTDNPNPKSLYMPDEKRNVQKSVDRSVSRIQAQSKQNGSNDAGSTSTATPTLSPKAITASPLPGSSSSTSPSYFNEPSESSKRYQSAFQNQFQQEGMGVGKRSIMFNNPTTVVTGDTKVQSIDVEESAPVRIDDPTLKHIQERNLRRF